MEKATQNKFGTSFTFNSEKGFSINGEYAYYDNNFTGNATSPVGFQMLKGLQNGKNGVWRLLLQKNITQYLDLTNIPKESFTQEVIFNGISVPDVLEDLDNVSGIGPSTLENLADLIAFD